jgi:hypothetical protein
MSTCQGRSSCCPNRKGSSNEADLVHGCRVVHVQPQRSRRCRHRQQLKAATRTSSLRPRVSTTREVVASGDWAASRCPGMADGVDGRPYLPIRAMAFGAERGGRTSSSRKPRPRSEQRSVGGRSRWSTCQAGRRSRARSPRLAPTGARVLRGPAGPCVCRAAVDVPQGTAHPSALSILGLKLTSSTCGRRSLPGCDRGFDRDR